MLPSLRRKGVREDQAVEAEVAVVEADLLPLAPLDLTCSDLPGLEDTTDPDHGALLTMKYITVHPQHPLKADVAAALADATVADQVDPASTLASS